MLPNIVFEKEIISHSNLKRLQAWSLYKAIWKHTNLCNKGVFSHYSLASLMNKCVKISQVCYLMYVGIRQVRLMVFVIYRGHFCGQLEDNQLHCILQALFGSTWIIFQTMSFDPQEFLFEHLNVNAFSSLRLPRTGCLTWHGPSACVIS